MPLGSTMVSLISSLQALSNQKYREMLAEFGDVGLMTGDVTINPSATCLVMTTEVCNLVIFACPKLEESSIDFTLNVIPRL